MKSDDVSHFIPLIQIMSDALNNANCKHMDPYGLYVVFSLYGLHLALDQINASFITKLVMDFVIVLVICGTKNHATCCSDNIVFNECIDVTFNFRVTTNLFV